MVVVCFVMIIVARLCFLLFSVCDVLRCVVFGVISLSHDVVCCVVLLCVVLL